MSTPTLCPICRRAMNQVEEGVWQCPNDPTHEFHDNSDAEPQSPESRRPSVSFPCPGCSAELNSVRPGVWRCAVNDGHEFMADPEPQDEPPEPPQVVYQAQGYSFEPEAKRFNFMPKHLRSMGLMGKLPPIRLGNTGDGTYCQPLGPVAPGGGSKSGRSRKKGDKGGKKFVDEPWKLT